MTAHLAPSLVRFWDEVDDRWPHRDNWSDGWLGDNSHATRFSDHNPDESFMQWVHAVDTDATLTHTMGSGPVGDEIVKALLKLARSGKPHPINYIIYKGVIYSRSHGFRARAYTGSNSHHSHVHLSIMRTDFARSWKGSWGIRQVNLPDVDVSWLQDAFDHPTEFVHPEHVKRFQQMLVERDLLEGRYVKGRPGKKTRDAWRQFAKNNDLQLVKKPGYWGVKLLNKKTGEDYQVVR